MKPTKSMQPELEVEKVPIDLLTPYANNAKRHSREQVDQIAKSITEFGNCDPIAVWTNPKGELEVVEGHGRLYALEQLGFTEVPVFRLDHLTDAQRRQYTHVHNQLTMNTGWDFSILQDEFDAMPDFEWVDFGFDIGGEDENNTYSQKTEGLLYEPTGVLPEVEKLCDAGEYERLIRLIDNADVPAEVKRFLQMAATRFIEFDYEKVADYYCNIRDAGVREMFDELKLVIVDKGAIEEAAIGLVDFYEGL